MCRATFPPRFFVLILTLALGTVASAQKPTPPCSQCGVWNAPQEPFKIYGNTYYVGPHGLSSILITSPAGDVLLDGDLPESAAQIAAHIRSLGFRVEDIKLIGNTHVHFDHAGGIAELQRMSGARVVASAWTADVLRKGDVSHEDPQYGIIRNTPRVAHVETLHDGETFRIGDIAITAHLTPGHTPGGTSWTWKSCENGRCLDMVYADSLSPVSAAGFRFLDHVPDFERSSAFLRATPCDILLTAHPDASDFWQRVARMRESPDAMLTPNGCKALADRAQAKLAKRLDEERGKR